MKIIIDKGHDEPIYGKQCASCKHLHLPPRQRKTTCAAFPNGDGVPIDILLGKFDHAKAYPGDHGIQYEKKD